MFNNIVGNVIVNVTHSTIELLSYIYVDYHGIYSYISTISTICTEYYVTSGWRIRTKDDICFCLLRKTNLPPAFGCACVCVRACDCIICHYQLLAVRRRCAAIFGLILDTAHLSLL